MSTHYCMGGNGETIYLAVLKLIQSRLDQKGEIRTNEAWMICCRQTQYSYTTVALAFRAIMVEMIDRREAIVIKPGLYFISKDQRELQYVKIRATHQISDGVEIEKIKTKEPPKRLEPWYSDVYKTTLGTKG